MTRRLAQPTHQQELSDRLLIEHACAGDDTAFAILVQRYHGQVYRLVCACLDGDEADDVVQFVWLQFYRFLSTLQSNPPSRWSETSLRSWLLRVARNRCLDERRWRKRHSQFFFSALQDSGEEEVLTALPDPAPLPEEQVEQQEEQERLCAAIRMLPPRARTIVWLRYTEELSFSDIGCRLQIPTSVVKTAFYRACMKLRAALSSE